MKAIRLHDYGGPEVLQYEDVEDPTPAAGEVLIEQSVIGVNFADVMMREGKYFLKPDLPAIPGLEGTGVVTALGEGVSSVSVGQRVGYVMSLGAYAEQKIQPAENVVPIPEGVSDEFAGATLLRGMTAHYLLKSSYAVSSEDTVLVHSAAGGMGSLLVQWSKHLGATVIGTVSTDEKAAVATRLGCDLVINYSEQDFAKEARAYTDDKGVNVVYDAVGASTYEGNIEALGIRGYLINYGNASGPIPPIDAMQINSKSLFFNKSSLPHYALTMDERNGRAADYFDLVAQGALSPEVSHIYPLADAAQAQIDIGSRKTTGAVALRA